MEERAIPYDTMLDYMDEARVNAGILVPPGGIYGNDIRYTLDGVAAHPDRFAAMVRINHRSPSIAADIRALRETPAILGIRITVFTDEQRKDWYEGLYEPALKAIAENDLLLTIYPPGMLPELPALAARYPKTTIAIDHVGLRQSPLLPEGAPVFADLPDLLAISEVPNLVIKLSGAHDLSREPYPFADTKGPIRQIMGAWGVERLMWGSDWTRDVKKLPYSQTVDYLRDSPAFSDEEKTLILSENLCRIFRWRPEVLS
jgi:L-fuconolactonase